MLRRAVACCPLPSLLQVPETKGLTLEELNGEDMDEVVDPEAVAAGQKAAAVDAV
jgi:hypothetical protein